MVGNVNSRSPQPDSWFVRSDTRNFHPSFWRVDAYCQTSILRVYVRHHFSTLPWPKVAGKASWQPQLGSSTTRTYSNTLEKSPTLEESHLITSQLCFQTQNQEPRRRRSLPQKEKWHLLASFLWSYFSIIIWGSCFQLAAEITLFLAAPIHWYRDQCRSKITSFQINSAPHIFF